MACSKEEELPHPTDDLDYSYTYSDPRNKFIDILRRSLEHYLDRHQDCDPHSMEKLLALIPMKIKGKLSYRLGLEGYGMQAVVGWSAFRVLLLFVFFLLTSLIFPVFWLVGHPQDFQTAFTVPTFMFAVLCPLLLLLDWLRISE